MKKAVGSAVIKVPDRAPGQAVEHPAQNDSIADGDTQGSHQRQPADHAAHPLQSRVPLLKAPLIGADGPSTRQTADAELSGQAHPAKQENEQQIGDQEGRPSILAQPIGKQPDVTQPHSRTNTGDDKAYGGTKSPVLVFFLICHTLILLISSFTF